MEYSVQSKARSLPGFILLPIYRAHTWHAIHDWGGVEWSFTPLSTIFQSYRSDKLLVQMESLHHQGGDVECSAFFITKLVKI